MMGMGMDEEEGEGEGPPVVVVGVRMRRVVAGGVGEYSIDMITCVEDGNNMNMSEGNTRSDE